MGVIVAVLAVLALVLLVLFFLVLEINSNFFPPEVVEIIYKIEITKDVPGLITQENIGTYLEVLTGIVALLFPISLSIITEVKGKYFSSQEVTSVVFKQWQYKGLYVVLFILIGFTFASFWKTIQNWVLIGMLGSICGSLIFLFFFFRKLEEIISDFSKLVREKEKSKINDLLKNGKN